MSAVVVLGSLGRRANTCPSGTWVTSFVAADAGSTYEPYPTLKYRWDLQNSAPHPRQHSAQGAEDIDMGPRLLTAGPTSPHFESQVNDEHLEGPHVREQSVLGTEIYVYSGRLGSVSTIHVSIHSVDLVLGYSVPYR